jgi:hypothetical protein
VDSHPTIRSFLMFVAVSRNKLIAQECARFCIFLFTGFVIIKVEERLELQPQAEPGVPETILGSFRSGHDSALRRCEKSGLVED